MQFEMEANKISPPIDPNGMRENVKTWWEEIIEAWPPYYPIFTDGDHHQFVSSVVDGLGANNVEKPTLTGSEAINEMNQLHPESGVERIQLGKGLFFTDADINQIIQSVNAFAASHGITLTGVNDERNNADFMNIIASSWHA